MWVAQKEKIRKLMFLRVAVCDSIVQFIKLEQFNLFLVRIAAVYVFVDCLLLRSYFTFNTRIASCTSYYLLLRAIVNEDFECEYARLGVVFIAISNWWRGDKVGQNVAIRLIKQIVSMLWFETFGPLIAVACVVADVVLFKHADGWIVYLSLPMLCYDFYSTVVQMWCFSAPIRLFDDTQVGNISAIDGLLYYIICRHCKQTNFRF